MNLRIQFAENLAAVLLSADWRAEALEAAALGLLGRDRAPKWLRQLIAEILEKSATPYPPSPETLKRLIRDSAALSRPRPSTLQAESAVITPPRFAPLPAFAGLGLPELSTLGALSDWIGLPVAQLAWFADVEGYRSAGRQEATRHYVYRWLPKASGPPRLLEAPKPILKRIQRQILREILDPVPLHQAAHGFRKGRSCLTAAERHAGEAAVLSLDIRDFFHSIPARSVHGLFRSLGYPWAVARHLTGLCSTATPGWLFEAPEPIGHPVPRSQALLRRRHLPQGAPTSPALANLCAWRLDCRLQGLARALDARYTRYADDLAFSGDRDFARRLDGLLTTIARICGEQGFALHPGKTRIMRRGGRQWLTGLVINQHINLPREGFDRLKATLHNCLRHGPAGQNREHHPDFRAHLDGRITWLETVNPRKGHRLRLLFQQIDWP